MLTPLLGVWVCKINHSEFYTNAFNQVGLARAVFNKVAFFASFYEQISCLATNLGKVSDVRTAVNHWFDTVHGPLIDHLVPLWVLLWIQLPIPHQAGTLGELMLAHPVLHPHTGKLDSNLL